MKLYCNAQSRSNTILPLLKELDIEDQVELIELEYGTTMRSAEYLALNPLGKVPCLVDGEAVISETPAIFAYLADKFAEKGFAPALNDPKRGEYYKWLFFGHGPVTEFMNIKALNIPPETLAKQRGSISFGDEEAMMNFLRQGLSNAKPYLLGEQITVADLYIAYWLTFGISFKIIPYDEAFKPFLKTIQQRDAVKDVTWIQSI